MQELEREECRSHRGKNAGVTEGLKAGVTEELNAGVTEELNAGVREGRVKESQRY